MIWRRQSKNDLWARYRKSIVWNFLVKNSEKFFFIQKNKLVRKIIHSFFDKNNKLNEKIITKIYIKKLYEL